MPNKAKGHIPPFDKERLKDIERTFLDPDYLILLANALKAERAARIEAETRLNQMLMKKKANSEKKNADLVSNTASSFLTVNQAAHELNVSTKTVYRRILSKEIPAQYVAQNCIRIERSDFEAYKSELKGRRPYTRKVK